MAGLHIPPTPIALGCYRIRALLVGLTFALATFAHSDQPQSIQFQTLRPWTSPRLYVLGRWHAETRKLEWLSTNQNVSLMQDLRPQLNQCEDLRLRTANANGRETLVANDEWILVEVDAAVNQAVVKLEFGGSCRAETRLAFKQNFERNSLKTLRPEARLIFSSRRQTLAGQNIQVKESYTTAQLVYSIEGHLPYRFYSLSENLHGLAVEARGSVMSRRWWNLGLEMEISQSMKTLPKDLADSQWSLSLNKRFFYSVLDGLSFTPQLGVRRRLLLDNTLLVSEQHRRLSWIFVRAEVELQYAKRWMLRPRIDFSLQALGASTSHTQSLELALGTAYRVSPRIRLFYEATWLDIRAKTGTWKMGQLSPLVLGTQLEF